MRLIIPVGVPGSGKSTLAKSFDGNTTKIVSSDMVRLNLFGDDALQYTDKVANRQIIKKKIRTEDLTAEELLKLKIRVCNELVFGLVDKQTREYLEAGYDVVYDATNIYRSGRKKTLEKFKGLYDEAIAYYFDIPIEVAKQRNQERNRTVPEEVIEAMYRKMQEPTLKEGFSEVIRIR